MIAGYSTTDRSSTNYGFGLSIDKS